MGPIITNVFSSGVYRYNNAASFSFSSAYLTVLISERLELLLSTLSYPDQAWKYPDQAWKWLESSCSLLYSQNAPIAVESSPNALAVCARNVEWRKSHTHRKCPVKTQASCFSPSFNRCDL